MDIIPFEIEEFQFESFHCPMCSSDLSIQKFDESYEVICKKCDCIIHISESQDEIRIAFNNSPPAKKQKIKSD